MLVFGERGKPEYPGKNLSEQSRQPTNSTHIWRPIRESNPGHWWKASALTSDHCTNTAPQATKGWDNKDLLNHQQHQVPLVEMEKSSRKIRQSLSAISSKDFLLQWRSSKARCFSCSRSFFIRLLHNRIQATTINLIYSINSKSKLDRTIFEAYCLLGVSYYAVLVSEWVSESVSKRVSECNNRIRALNELCWSQSDVPRSLKLPRRRTFLQSILQKCCLVTSLGPVWFKMIFWVITGAVSYMQL